MRTQKKVEYGILSILLLLTLKTRFHFGDFCEGMANGLLFIFLGLVFIICLIIILIYNLYKFIKTAEKFDFIPFYLCIIFIISNSFLIVANENHFWKQIRHEGSIENDGGKISIILFENNSFEVINFHVENRCIIRGNYHFEKNLLILEDDKVELKTDGKFTSRYLLMPNNILQPLNSKFSKIELKK